MQHLFLVDPVAQLDPDHDTSLAFMWEVRRRGGEVWTAQSSDLTYAEDGIMLQARRFTAQGYGSLDQAESTTELSEQELDRIWIREDPPFDEEYLTSTYLLEHAKIPVVNEPRGIRNWNEKLGALGGVSSWMPPTRITAREKLVRDFLADHDGRAVAKSLYGYGGEGVFVLNDDDPNLTTLIETLTNRGNRRIMVQEYLPEVIEEGDRRLLVLDGEPLGSLRRRPDRGDFRGNLHSGGSAHEDQVTDVDRRLCAELAPELKKHGLHFVGVDLIGDRLLEVNVTSPTCLREINQLHGTKLQRSVVDYVEQL